MFNGIPDDILIRDLPEEEQEQLENILDLIPPHQLADIAGELGLPYHMQFHPYNVICCMDESGHICAEKLIAFENHVQNTPKEDQNRFLPTRELETYLMELSDEHRITVFAKAMHIIATCVCKNEGKSEDQVNETYKDLLSMFTCDDEITVHI